MAIPIVCRMGMMPYTLHRPASLQPHRVPINPAIIARSTLNQARPKTYNKVRASLKDLHGKRKVLPGLPKVLLDWPQSLTLSSALF